MSNPLFSIVTPVYDTPLDVLKDMLDSVRLQTYQNWELIVIDDCSPNPEVLEMLHAVQREEPRVRVIAREANGHIVAASNDGIDAAKGDFLVLLDHDDMLVHHALLRVADVISKHPDVDYIYSDENKIGDLSDRSDWPVLLEGAALHPSGCMCSECRKIREASKPRVRFYDHFRKPKWSPERLRGQMYTSHLSVLRMSLVREVGAFRTGFDGSQDHDLVLRVTEQCRRIAQIPEVLYHWRAVPGSAAADQEAKPYAWEAGCRAVQEHLDRSGIEATASLGRVPGTYSIKRTRQVNETVSVVIPTRGGQGIVWGERRVFVEGAVSSLLNHAGAVRLEVVVVYDTATPQEVLENLKTICEGRAELILLEYTKPFNYSEKCNVGALASTGEVILMLNDDVEIVSEDFVHALVAPLSEAGVGMTGARLLFADSTIQHAGLVYRQGAPWHAYYQEPNETYGVASALLINREVTGLTGACIALSRNVFEEAGGLSEQLPVNFNDVDFSLKVGSLGYRLIWLADAVAHHFESKTRVAKIEGWEHLLLMERWPSEVMDPYMPTESIIDS